MDKRVNGRKAVLLLMIPVMVTILLIGAWVSTASRRMSTADKVDKLMAGMSLDEKIGQMTMVGRKYLYNPHDIAVYHLGALLSGGGSAPDPNTPKAWADMYDNYQKQAMSASPALPILYGLDAVHGDNNVQGATIFPHNIGLGAARDPKLVQKIGQATAEEVSDTGIDWTFSPCLCVARNERWGRTYESFGENPQLVASMASIVTGYQGKRLGATPYSIMATAKHWIGDGGTVNGVNEGDTQMSEKQLRALFLPPYKEAIKRGVASVMVSYSSWNGKKMHENKYLITDVLKKELGFNGIVLSDWGGVKKLPGATYEENIRDAVNAGIDMVMVPDDYKTFIADLKREVNAGRVPMSRINDAVRRILTKKYEMRLFDHPYTDRFQMSMIGSADHRALARQAVRESMVLLKNDHHILPLSKKIRKLFVAGKNADDIGNQSGGWTITWQGGSGNTTKGTTILQGIKAAVSPGTKVTYSKDGKGIDSSFDAAVVVIGETPYAETAGDRSGSLSLDGEDMAVLNRIEKAGVPMVVVMVSGRPLMIADELPKWQALVEAWLPGTEGEGVADVLFGDYIPRGKLPITWPKSAKQLPMHPGDANYDPLFPYGYGLTY